MAAQGVILKAFLEKRAVGKNVNVLNLGFHKRWFVLDKTALTYYDGKLSKQGKEKGKIEMAMVRGVETVDDRALEGKSNVIQVIHNTKERDDFLKLYIVTRSEEEQVKWVNVIRTAALSAGAKFLKKYHSGVWTDGMFTCCNAQGFLAAGCKEIQQSSKDQEPEKSSSSTESPGRRPPSRSLPKAPESGPSITTAADTGNHERRESQRNREKAPLKQTTSTSSSVERQYSSSGGRQESQRQTSLTNPLKRKYQAIFSYRPTSSDELELQEGQLVEIQEELDKDWCNAVNIENGDLGVAPTSYLREVTSVEYYSWYFGGTSKEECRSFLEERGQAGCFLVRDSSEKGHYALSVFDGGKTRHFRIENTAEDKVFIIKGTEFTSVPALIEHYHEKECVGPAECKLTCFPESQ
uniref:Tyrosine-protein kinase BTK-like n=1 Tax=Crassostrea virginica TaxID=6565 RepID=A0A8B8D4I1_CRAVI|nr:tyrosine-protein kinase BTK-like [Crassostrea virginica]